MPYVTRASGALLLLLAGAYVASYGWYEIRLLGGGTADDPVVSTATLWQGTVTRWLDRLGPAAPVLGAIGVLLALVWAARLMRRRKARSPGAGEPRQAVDNRRPDGSLPR
jgi:hypothetical protein